MAKQNEYLGGATSHCCCMPAFCSLLFHSYYPKIYAGKIDASLKMSRGTFKKMLFWKEVLHTPLPTLDCIKDGYRLQLKFVPPYIQQIYTSAKSHCIFIDEAVDSLLSNWCAMRVEKKPHVCSLLSVVSKSMGDLCLVLNQP